MADLLRDGGKTGGWIKFGYDRIVTMADGSETRLDIYATRETPGATKIRLEQTLIPGHVEAVRWAFESFADGSSLSAIAEEFGRRGLLAPPDHKHPGGRPFDAKMIKAMLKDPVYVGVPPQQTRPRPGA